MLLGALVVDLDARIQHSTSPDGAVMEIRVTREHYSPDYTIGRMLIDGRFECYTLEDGIRTNKVYGETAIPVGRYPVTITHSPSFKRLLPLLENVPNFSGIRIHPGNSKVDTLGCILVGQGWTPGADRISASRLAFDALFPKIEAALRAGQSVVLTIEQPNAPPELATRAIAPPVAKRRRKISRPEKRGKTVSKPASQGKKASKLTTPKKKAAVKRAAKSAARKQTTSTAAKAKSTGKKAATAKRKKG
jgi:hypothetical protein